MSEREKQAGDMWRGLKDATTSSSLYDFAVAERATLWAELAYAIRHSANGRWSMQCDSLIQRIADLTQLIGPEPWEGIQIELLESGLWQEFHCGVGMSPPQPDMERVAAIRRSIDESVASLRGPRRS